jgi:CDP-diacylglycerol---serine O-phosphatidyltransferase
MPKPKLIYICIKFYIIMKGFRSIITQIPNVITSLNLFTGCISIVLAFNDHLYLASLLIFLAGLFDFFDGLVARMMNAYSEFGKSLDSLADAVSFGVAPSIIIFELIAASIRKNNPGFTFNSADLWQIFQLSAAFLIAVFSAIRLAKFNIDKRQTSSFIGVPTPANAFLISSIPFVIRDYPLIGKWILNVYILIPLVLVLSFLLVSELPMLSFKFKNLSFGDNKSKYILAGASLILFLLFQISAFPLIFVLYLVLSLTNIPPKHA